METSASVLKPVHLPPPFPRTRKSDSSLGVGDILNTADREKELSPRKKCKSQMPMTPQPVPHDRKHLMAGRPATSLAETKSPLIPSPDRKALVHKLQLGGVGRAAARMDSHLPNDTSDAYIVQSQPTIDSAPPTPSQQLSETASYLTLTGHSSANEGDLEETALVSASDKFLAIITYDRTNRQGSGDMWPMSELSDEVLTVTENQIPASDACAMTQTNCSAAGRLNIADAACSPISILNAASPLSVKRSPITAQKDKTSAPPTHTRRSSPCRSGPEDVRSESSKHCFFRSSKVMDVHASSSRISTFSGSLASPNMCRNSSWNELVHGWPGTFSTLGPVSCPHTHRSPNPLRVTPDRIIPSPNKLSPRIHTIVKPSPVRSSTPPRQPVITRTSPPKSSQVCRSLPGAISCSSSRSRTSISPHQTPPIPQSKTAPMKTAQRSLQNCPLSTRVIDYQSWFFGKAPYNSWKTKVSCIRNNPAMSPVKPKHNGGKSKANTGRAFLCQQSGMLVAGAEYIFKDMNRKQCRKLDKLHIENTVHQTSPVVLSPARVGRPTGLNRSESVLLEIYTPDEGRHCLPGAKPWSKGRSESPVTAAKRYIQEYRLTSSPDGHQQANQFYYEDLFVNTVKVSKGSLVGPANNPSAERGVCKDSPDDFRTPLGVSPAVDSTKYNSMTWFKPIGRQINSSFESLNNSVRMSASCSRGCKKPRGKTCPRPRVPIPRNRSYQANNSEQKLYIRRSTSDNISRSLEPQTKNTKPARKITSETKEKPTQFNLKVKSDKPVDEALGKKKEREPVPVVQQNGPSHLPTVVKTSGSCNAQNAKKVPVQNVSAPCTQGKPVRSQKTTVPKRTEQDGSTFTATTPLVLTTNLPTQSEPTSNKRGKDWNTLDPIASPQSKMHKKTINKTLPTAVNSPPINTKTKVMKKENSLINKISKTNRKTNQGKRTRSPKRSRLTKRNEDIPQLQNANTKTAAQARKFKRVKPQHTQTTNAKLHLVPKKIPSVKNSETHQQRVFTSIVAGCRKTNIKAPSTKQKASVRKKTKPCPKTSRLVKKKPICSLAQLTVNQNQSLTKSLVSPAASTVRSPARSQHKPEPHSPRQDSRPVSPAVNGQKTNTNQIVEDSRSATPEPPPALLHDELSLSFTESKSSEFVSFSRSTVTTHRQTVSPLTRKELLQGHRPNASRHSVASSGNAVRTILLSGEITGSHGNSRTTNTVSAHSRSRPVSDSPRTVSESTTRSLPPVVAAPDKSQHFGMEYALLFLVILLQCLMYYYCPVA